MGNYLNIGVLGCSDIARRKFIPAATHSKQARLVAMASRVSAEAALFNSWTTINMLEYEALISDPGIDLIYISLPNHLHEEWSLKALFHGKHIICEKPLGLSTASVNRMLDTADKRGLLLFENLMYLNHPQHSAVKAALDNMRIGRIHSLHCTFTIPMPAEGNFRLAPSMGGGAFHDLNRYPLSAAQFFLTGKRHRLIEKDVEVAGALNLCVHAASVTDKEEHFSFLIAFGRHYQSFYEIQGEHGKIRVNRAFTTPCDMKNTIEVTVNGKDESFSIPPCDHFLSTIDKVSMMIRQGENFDSIHIKTRELAELADLFQ